MSEDRLLPDPPAEWPLELAISDAELIGALTEVARQRIVQAPHSMRAALSPVLAQSPKVIVEARHDAAIVVVTDRQGLKRLDFLRRKYGTIVPGLFEVEKSRAKFEAGGEPVQILGRDVTILSDSGRMVDITQYNQNKDLTPLYFLHPDTSFTLRNVRIGRRSQISDAYDLSLACILVFGRELTRADAAQELDFVLGRQIAMAWRELGFGLHREAQS